MNNVYHSDIMNLLIHQGREGMRLCNIARRIFNKHVDLFDNKLDYTDLRRAISSYMWSQSRRKDSPFVRIGYGIYAVKPDIAVQLDLFWDYQHESVSNSSPVQTTARSIQLTFQF